jgi:16S rRNA (cytidine1402-2'-O)-methyltransferase
MSKLTPRSEQAQSRLEPGLYVIATPLGNARDITLRALDVLRNCDAVLAEDTRTTSKLLAIHAISRPLVAYNDHNAPRVRPAILARLRQGQRLALVSDAGTPLVSDPGYKLVREAIAEGSVVSAIPGPSAVLASLVLSGLPTDRFLFAGFLPPTRAARRTVLEELKPVRSTLIFFEAPLRVAESLNDMRDVLGAREAAIARELTKLHEEVRRDALENLATMYSGNPTARGEITIVVGPPKVAAPDFGRTDTLLDKALAFMPMRAAVDLVSEALKLPRRAVYVRALARKEHTRDDV